MWRWLDKITLFNLNSEYILRQASLDEQYIGVIIGGRLINNLRYADDTTLLAESKDELIQLVTSVKEKSAQAGPEEAQGHVY